MSLKSRIGSERITDIRAFTTLIWKGANLSKVFTLLKGQHDAVELFRAGFRAVGADGSSKKLETTVAKLPQRVVTLERRMANLAYFQLCSSVFQQLGEKRHITKGLNIELLKLGKNLKGWDVPKMDIGSLGATIALLYNENVQRFENSKILAPLKNVFASSKIFVRPG